jgi:hypothetical protein
VKDGSINKCRAITSFPIGNTRDNELAVVHRNGARSAFR